MTSEAVRSMIERNEGSERQVEEGLQEICMRSRAIEQKQELQAASDYWVFIRPFRSSK